MSTTRQKWVDLLLKEAYNLGELFVGELENRQTFGFESFDQRQEARDAVNSGDIYFALVTGPKVTSFGQLID